MPPTIAIDDVERRPGTRARPGRPTRPATSEPAIAVTAAATTIERERQRARRRGRRAAWRPTTRRAPRHERERDLGGALRPLRGDEQDRRRPGSRMLAGWIAALEHALERAGRASPPPDRDRDDDETVSAAIASCSQKPARVSVILRSSTSVSRPRPGRRVAAPAGDGGQCGGAHAMASGRRGEVEEQLLEPGALRRAEVRERDGARRARRGRRPRAGRRRRSRRRRRALAVEARGGQRGLERRRVAGAHERAGAGQQLLAASPGRRSGRRR